MTAAFRTIAILARSGDPAVADTCQTLCDYVRARGGRAAVLEDGPVAGLAGADALSANALTAACDLAVAVGGDGTMLHAATLVAPAAIPLVGINRGRLGFLADVAPGQIEEKLGPILDGRYAKDSRLLLKATLRHADGESLSALALNDIVVQKYAVGHMLEVEVHIGDAYVNTHRGDGLIVSTPTGSTAYALSGGGPIMAPDLDVVTLVPICPHTLSDRPVVVAATATIAIRAVDKKDSPAQVMADGALLGPIGNADTLEVAAANERVTLLHPADYDYFRRLRSKLAWGRDRAGS